MNDIKFVRQNGGLNRQLAGTDHISLLLLYGILGATLQSYDATSIEEMKDQGLTPADVMLFYHANEFFRVAPGARLILKCVDGNATTYNEIRNLQHQHMGLIKQAAIWNGTAAFDASRVMQINEIAKKLASENMPVFCLYSPSLVPADYASLINLNILDAENVGVIIAQDNSGYGVLSTGNEQTGIGGAALGALARSQVHTSLQWVAKQNMVEGFYKNINTNMLHPTRELDVLGFLGGNVYSDFTPGQIDALDSKGYLFLRKHIGTAGSYFNHSRTATTAASDYAFIENTRSMNKACRAVYQDLLPFLGSPAYIDRTTGYIDAASIASLEAVAETGLAVMERDGELSAYKVQINPNQTILTTGKLLVKVRIIPVGVLREMEVNIGFTLKLNS